MSIVIKTDLKKMPRQCFKCPFGVVGKAFIPLTDKWEERRYTCIFNDRAMLSTKRNNACPLVEVEGE